MKRLRSIEGTNEKQLKALKDQRENKLKIFSQNKIKAPLLNSIYNKVLQKGNKDNDDVIRIFKTLENLESLRNWLW